MAEKTNSSNKFEKRIFAAMAIFGFIGAMICLSPNMTGNVISELSQDSSNLLAIVFLIIGFASVGIMKIRD